MDLLHLVVAASTHGRFALLLLLIFGPLLLSKYLVSRDKRKAKRAPEAGGAWPVIGHLHQLSGRQPAHITLGNMADIYGPIFTVKLGMHRALVVNNWEAAKECVVTNDKVFANRPKSLAMEVMGYNNAMFGFAPYGPHWRRMRKVTTHELLSNQRLEMLKHVRESAVKAFLQDLYSLWSNNRKNSGKVLVEMKSWFRDMTLNLILKIIVGKQISDRGRDNERWKKALSDFFKWSGEFVILDAFPSLRWLDIAGEERAMKKVAGKLDEVVEEWLQEHKRKRNSNEFNGEEDFMDVLLSILSDTEEYPADVINKATCLALVLAGGDGTSITLVWALSLILNNPESLKKVQHELDLHVGKDRLVEESDTQNLEYLQAIIKETMRLYPPLPLFLPHESLEDCTVGGYKIPKGTRLLVNASKIQRDATIWPDPLKFKPERFLTTHKNVDLWGQNLELIPFGSGRRMCPAVPLAVQILRLTLASFLHGFEVQLDEQIDMTETAGLSNDKATPLKILISPRLPSHLYAQMNA